MLIPIPSEPLQYSAVAAGLVFALGYVISVQYYGRVGVGHADLPSLLAVSTGLSFVLITVFFTALGSMAQKATPRLGVEIVCLFAMAILVIATQYFVFRGGLIFYCSTCAILGITNYFSRLIRVEGSHIVIDNPISAALFLLILVSVYTTFAYPNLSRALGGAAPKAVELAFAKGKQPSFLKDGDKVFELLQTPNAFYLAVEPGVPDVCQKSKSVFGLLRTLPFTRGTRFVCLPTDLIEFVRYTDEWDTPPKFNVSKESSI